MSHIESLLEKDKGNRFFNETITTKKAAKLLDVSVSSLYKMTHTNEIPFYKPGGNKLYFKKEEPVNRILQHRIKSQSEIELEAINYVVNNHLKKFR
ncbi:helix-turn-helix domain-containing protein [Mucilaginibacter gossypiicola]|uniref:helix-turn-helix domain-containing protein n=1 Tax=Mucilaginibacter gossypiicola TaxID=551995 RepID=UPI00142F584F